MVYVNILSAAPVVYVPLNGWDGNVAELVLSVRNTTDGTEVTPEVSGITAVGFLACITLAGTDGLHTGEWEYRLADALGRPVASGLMVVYTGDYEPAVQYESENKVIQYGG